MSVAVQDKFLYLDQVWEVYKIDGDNAEVVQVGDTDPHIVTVPISKLEELSRIAVKALKEELALSECMVDGAIIGGDEGSIKWAENRVKWLKGLVSSLDLDNKKTADRHSASFQVYQRGDEFIVDFEDNTDDSVVKPIKEILKNRDYNSANSQQTTYTNIGAAWEDEVKGLEEDLKKHAMQVLVDDQGGLRKMFHVYYDTLTPSNPET